MRKDWTQAMAMSYEREYKDIAFLVLILSCFFFIFSSEYVHKIYSVVKV